MHIPISNCDIIGFLFCCLFFPFLLHLLTLFSLTCTCPFYLFLLFGIDKLTPIFCSSFSGSDSFFGITDYFLWQKVFSSFTLIWGLFLFFVLFFIHIMPLLWHFFSCYYISYFIEIFKTHDDESNCTIRHVDY